MQILNRIRVVLVEPTHPGNIGAVARAMKTMGLGDLVLVKPKKFPHYEAEKRAAGAKDVLEQSRVVKNIDEAISDCTRVFGTSVRDREVSWPTLAPAQAAIDTLDHLNAHPHGQTALVFGRESSGLTNRELDLCHAQIRIPANAQYSSLNLGSAVQIMAYEMHLQALNTIRDSQNTLPKGSTGIEKRQRSATIAELDGHIQHLKITLTALDFTKTDQPTLLMRKLTRLYNKADLTVEEIQILRGILSAVQNKIS